MVERDFENYLRYEIKDAYKKEHNLFICNCSLYIMVNTFFVFYCISNNETWFLQPFLIWGAGVALHYFLGLKRRKLEVKSKQKKILNTLKSGI